MTHTAPDYKAALSSLLSRLKKLAHNVASIALGIGGALVVLGIIQSPALHLHLSALFPTFFDLFSKTRQAITPGALRLPSKL